MTINAKKAVIITVIALPTFYFVSFRISTLEMQILKIRKLMPRFFCVTALINN